MNNKHMFLEETNLAELKKLAKFIFKIVPLEPMPNFPILCNHPFTDSMAAMDMDGHMLDLSNEDDYNKWKTLIFRHINKVKKIDTFYMMIRKPYLLTFLKYGKDDMSRADFSRFLAEAWVLSENPNGDINVSIPELIEFFKEADKDYLMDEDDRKYFDSLPEEITIYRGISSGRNPKGLSWTDNKEKAEWFRDRWKSADCHLLTTTIRKEYALAYLNTRDEHEIVVDSTAVWENCKIYKE